VQIPHKFREIDCVASPLVSDRPLGTYIVGTLFPSTLILYTRL
jgi:hypothetical protein